MNPTEDEETEDLKTLPPAYPKPHQKSNQSKNKVKVWSISLQKEYQSSYDDLFLKSDGNVLSYPLSVNLIAELIF